MITITLPGDKVAFDSEGYPANLSAASLDALDWLIEFYNADMNLRLSDESQAINMERLHGCIVALKGYLRPLLPAEVKK